MINIAGGKGANLGELISLGIRVPPGFVVTSYAYKYFISYNKLDEKIREIFEKEKDDETISEKVKKLILEGEIPKDLREQILSAYDSLAKMVGKEILVATRSSATAEDIESASFAGQQETYLNVTRDELLDTIKKVWASLYTARAISYRRFKRIDQVTVEMAVVVQKMVNSKAAGVMFTLHPVTGDKNYIMIESSWGLGEAVVSGKVTPDEVLVEKSTLRIVEKKTSHKVLKIVYDKQKKENLTINLTGEEADSMSLSDEEAIELAKLALKIEQHYGRPMDIEWAIDADLKYPDNVFIVQARPETYWSNKQKEERKEEVKIGVGKVLTRGLPASPGIAFGRARVILDVKDAKDFEKGTILVTRMTDPDWVPIMKIASAIIT
ncbi:MAG: phosphoenolpyruvate synthase, partial [Sulfolobus sp.]|nr:phosphoenolpyruvate synthase [Sulfolobus sp.]